MTSSGINFVRLPSTRSHIGPRDLRQRRSPFLALKILVIVS